MRKLLLVAGLAAAALIPSLAVAQPSCEQQRDNRVVGTLAGAGIGALLGSAIAGHDDRAAGAVVVCHSPPFSRLFRVWRFLCGARWGRRFRLPTASHSTAPPNSTSGS